MQDYQTQFQRTQASCEKLMKLDLLEPMQAKVALESGEHLSLSGFMAVDRKRLKALSGEALADLARTDELELIYLHLQSMRNFKNARNRLVVIPGGKSQAADPVKTEVAAAKLEDQKATGT